MSTEFEIKSLVREKYSLIAEQSKSENKASCCGSTPCCTDRQDSLMAENYQNTHGYVEDADLGLGCGLPTEFAKINSSDTVIDLGSGAGNDCFVARAAVGESGKVIGIDFTQKMIQKARENAEKLNYNNVEFRLGHIDNMPVTSNKADVIVSNCVLNLVPNKHKVFSEIFRVLKPGGHFSISDIVLEGELPENWKHVAELYTGCVSGAIQKTDYLNIIQEAGFTNMKLQKEKEINLPDDLLSNYFSAEEVDRYKSGNSRIKSITVYADKPAKDERNCCEPNSSCC
jgi:ubiquinone/menaquinone biosynthesis C-methylase UbiE